jgi:site-specific recombinase XerD
VRAIRPIHPRDATDEDLRAFVLRLIEVEEYAMATVHQFINALRLLYVDLYRRPMVLGNLPRPKRERKLPVVLNGEEVRALFGNTGNPKHRVLLMMAYSAGLRVGELVRLRWEDIDAERRMIHIRGGKGKKDRYTILSDVVAEILTRYHELYRPKEWIFEGQSAQRHLSIRTAEYVFEQAARRAGIRKEVSIHSLRHAFATHMLEQGTDLRYIQHLLGHESIKTTEVYSHVSRKKVTMLRSPIDNLIKPEGT